MNLFFTPRRVLAYSQDFIESGCVGDFDENDAHDNSIATYATNYVIAAVCLIAVVKITLLTSNNNNNNNNNINNINNNNNNSITNKYMIGYFTSIGICFGMGGVWHHIVYRKDDPAYDILSRLVLLFYGISTACLALPTLQIVTDSVIAWWAVITLTTIVTLFNVIFIENFDYVGGAYNVILVLPSACFIYCRQARRHELAAEARYNNIAKSIAFILMILGHIVVILLIPVCDSPEAYENCFDDCPLPFENPTKFNQNFIFHILFAMGLIIFAIAEDQNPTRPMIRNENQQHQHHDKNDAMAPEKAGDI